MSEDSNLSSQKISDLGRRCRDDSSAPVLHPAPAPPAAAAAATKPTRTNFLTGKAMSHRTRGNSSSTPASQTNTPDCSQSGPPAAGAAQSNGDKWNCPSCDKPMEKKERECKSCKTLGPRQFSVEHNLLFVQRSSASSACRSALVLDQVVVRTVWNIINVGLIAAIHTVSFRSKHDTARNRAGRALGQFKRALLQSGIMIAVTLLLGKFSRFSPYSCGLIGALCSKAL